MPETDSFDVTVDVIPTSVIVDDVMYEVYPYDSTTIRFTWMDDKNSVGLAGFGPSITWPDSHSIIDHGNGTYSITADSTALHVGVYQLNVTFTRFGYTTVERMVEIEILELPIVLTYIDEINQFENETITVLIQIYDGPHATIVDWGQIVIELEGVQYQLVYQNSTQYYSVDIWLGTLTPGTYTLNFTATATDCEIETGEIQLLIESKILYTLVIEVDEQAQAGQVVQITIQASYSGGPLEGFDVEVHIIVERGQAAPQEYIEGASDLLEFLVPTDATRLTIWAEFEGAEGEWPAVSNTVNREVTPGGMNILSLDPITLTIIFGGGGGFLAGLILLRRRRRGVSTSSSVTEPIVAPTTTPAAPMGEVDILQDKIKGSADGLTRAQIAESLEISPSKAEKMMKKLLKSDSGFEIVEEGKLRRIRFSGE